LSSAIRIRATDTVMDRSRARMTVSTWRTTAESSDDGDRGCARTHPSPRGPRLPSEVAPPFRGSGRARPARLTHPALVARARSRARRPRCPSRRHERTVSQRRLRLSPAFRSSPRASARGRGRHLQEGNAREGALTRRAPYAPRACRRWGHACACARWPVTVSAWPSRR
jgi:hypothetical protein